MAMAYSEEASACMHGDDTQRWRSVRTGTGRQLPAPGNIHHACQMAGAPCLRRAAVSQSGSLYSAS